MRSTKGVAAGPEQDRTAVSLQQQSVAGEPMLIVERVHKRFDTVSVLEDVSLTLSVGKVLCLIGPSGSGKTTMLRCINYLERPDAGNIIVAGELLGYKRAKGRLYELPESAISLARSRTGMVFQHFNLFPHLTAVENVSLGPVVVRKKSREDAGVRAQELLAQVGLAGKGDRYPSELSGGEQQRVAIARALAMEPQLLLFDEPTSALDPELVGDVLGVMIDLARAGVTMVVATHEMGFAREVADEIVFMDRGKIIERGAPQTVLANPSEERTKAFIRRLVAR